jgi:hypothetical protein
MQRPLNDTVPTLVNDTTPTLERLSEQVRQLERRVQALEGRAPQPSSPSASDAPLPAWQSKLEVSPSESAGLIQGFGRAVLGVGGAYLLRAAAESGAVSWLLGAAAALTYSALWLYSAARTRQGRQAIIYAGTAAAILSPLLWETTVRFKILPPPVTAGLLLVLAAAGATVAWLRDRPAVASGVAWATVLPATATATALIVATGETVPFALALLGASAVVETAALRNRWLGMRPWLALLANIGVWLSIRIAAQPGLEAYRPVSRIAAIGVDLALVGIYAASVGLRTVWLRMRISLFEIAQLAAVYVLGLSGVIWLSQEPRLAGIVCLLIAAASYFVGFRRFNPADSSRADSRRNHGVYAFQGLAFLLAGSALLVSVAEPRPEVGRTAAILWAGIALAMLWISRQSNSPTPTIQGAISLAASVLASGLIGYGYLALAGAIPPELGGGPWIVALAAVAAYFLCPLAKWPRLAIAGMAAFGAAALLVAMLAPLLGSPPAAGWLAALRTAVACLIALLLGFAGSRWKRRELIWIGYATAALVTLKLFWEDFPNSSPASLAVSLLSYGALLVFGPRLIRPGVQR